MKNKIMNSVSINDTINFIHVRSATKIPSIVANQSELKRVHYCVTNTVIENTLYDNLSRLYDH